MSGSSELASARTPWPSLLSCKHSDHVELEGSKRRGQRAQLYRHELAAWLASQRDENGGLVEF